MCLVVSTLYIWAHNYYIVCAFVPLCVWIALCTYMSVLIYLCHTCIHILNYIVHVFVLILLQHHQLHQIFSFIHTCLSKSTIQSCYSLLPSLSLSLSLKHAIQAMYKHMYTNINIRVHANKLAESIYTHNCKLTPMNTMHRNGIHYIQCQYIYMLTGFACIYTAWRPYLEIKRAGNKTEQEEHRKLWWPGTKNMQPMPVHESQEDHPSLLTLACSTKCWPKFFRPFLPGLVHTEAYMKIFVTKFI